jgi:hypothetical protein
MAKTDIEELKKRALAAVPKKKQKVCEAALEEVKQRIAAKKIEEGILAGGAFAVGNAIEKLRKLKIVKQAGDVIKDVKGAASSAKDKYGMFRKLKASRMDAIKNATTGVGDTLKNTARANPYGAALVGGGTLGTAGLAAWGLKKPKKVQEAAPFEFAKKDGDKGDKAKESLDKAKEKVKGKKEKRVKYLKDEKGENLMRHGGPMFGKKRKEKSKEFIENMKKGGAKEVSKEDFIRSGRPPGSFMTKRNRGRFPKGARELDVNLFNKDK